MNAAHTPNLYLGIDTGGTYTDGVLLDPISRRVVKTVKTRTTHHDLRQCVSEVLAQLVPADPQSIALVSLSTTLATNAIVEGKRRPAALLLLGYDPDLVHSFKFHEQFASPDYFFIKGLHGLDGIERQPLDEAGVLAAAEAVRGQVDAFAVAAYGGPVNASHEERAAGLLHEATGLPVVQAHHLSSELNSIWRATTASLNASLLGNTQQFLDAVESMLEAHGLRCPVMIVRGDGSLVRADFARKRPVEIIHSGPATSAVGGFFLARDELASHSDDAGRALVVDMGGTTTDLAVIESGMPQIYEKAATVGPFQTCIHTIRAHSFGLGGDSRIGFDHWKRVTIGPERVLPVAYLCSQQPEARRDLEAALSRRVLYSENVEFWLLRRPLERPLNDDLAERILAALADGPVLFADLRKKTGSIPPFVLRELINRELVDRAALTPTDLLHVTGEYTPWDADSARRLVEAAARLWGEDAAAFVSRVRSLISRRITAEIVQFLSGRPLSDPRRDGFIGKGEQLDRWLYEESLSPADPFLGSTIFLKTPLIGIGAPAQAFLPPVARALGASLVLPEHHAVANAVGAVVGGIVFQAQAEVQPLVQGMGIGGYLARVASDQQRFARYSEAVAHARKALADHLMAQALAAGAESAVVEISEREIWDGMMELTGVAVGKLGQVTQERSKP